MSDESMDLNREELAAVQALQRLGERWPESLTLFSWSGSLVVFRTEDYRSGRSLNAVPHTDILGIPNDGGDPQ